MASFPADDAVGPTAEYWFDPSCPFTWRTAQWLAASAPARQMAVRWHLMSLALLGDGEDPDPDRRRALAATRAPLRVLAAAEAAHGSASRPALYFALARRRHDQGRDWDRAVLAESLAEAGLPESLADAADDADWDRAVAASHAAGQAAVGETSGSPVLSVDGTRAFFGPVLGAAVSPDEALVLLDGLRAMASVPAFAELKRSRRPR